MHYRDLSYIKTLSIMIPRSWNARFGTSSWVSNIPEFLLDEAPWEM
jgi:hypothetical protein